MHGALRKLAVTVNEERSRAFSWELVELLPDGAWSVVAVGDRPVRTYHLAMAEGLRELQRMVLDLDLGPREPVHDAEDGARPTRNTFGFGFGLPKYGHRDDS
ncbi:MAG: hypothetical protein DI563_02620 [Variovorax paradoxus]|uniref:Uncharacterized protein n=1 Tax=Variovorax paradoxus TaxID=34073 RepID=A0A2W5QLH6_VARPD|nr:MAG: hypothetical protein DI563_02620 [Variovorax paradoxus]